MNLLAGLEKFGLSSDDDLDITKEETKSPKREAPHIIKQEEKPLEEKDLVLERIVECPICGRKFHTLVVKTGKAKRLEPDNDLRPNFQGIDTVKYDAAVCPHCGYAALNKDFVHVSETQMRWIKEALRNFRPTDDASSETYSYDRAVDRYKLTLVNTIAKHGKMSEKAYICLKIAWLRRAQLKEIKVGTPKDEAKKKTLLEEYIGFYKQAYEGFEKAIATENAPYEGMDDATVEFMLANMAIFFKDYSAASKLVAKLLTAPTTPKRVKDKCVDLKDEILVELKKQKGTNS